MFFVDTFLKSTDNIESKFFSRPHIENSSIAHGIDTILTISTVIVPTTRIFSSVLPTSVNLLNQVDTSSTTMPIIRLSNTSLIDVDRDHLNRTSEFEDEDGNPIFDIPLDPELEKELVLAQAYIAESTMTPEELVLANKKFAVSVAKTYMKYGASFDDLTQEAYIGLVIASCRFKSSYGVKFISFAVHYIKMRIRKYLTFANNIVQQPDSFTRKLKTVATATTKFETDNGTEPTSTELAMLTGIAEKSIKKVIRDKITSVVSLNNTCNVDNSTEELDKIATIKSETPIPSEILEMKDAIEIINNKMHTVLSDMECLVVKQRFYDYKSLEEIGTGISRSPAGVKAILSRSLLKLKPLVAA